MRADMRLYLREHLHLCMHELQVAAAIEMGLQFPVIIVRKKRVQTGTAAKNSQGKEKEIQGKEAHNINSSSANPNAAAEHTSHNTSTANIRHSSLSVDDVMDAHTRQSRRGSRGSVYSRNSRRSSAATINSRRNSVEKGSVN